jgi:hypothetical protein
MVFGVVEGGGGERIEDGFGHVDQVGIVDQSVKQVKAGERKDGVETETEEKSRVKTRRLHNRKRICVGAGLQPGVFVFQGGSHFVLDGPR